MKKKIARKKYHMNDNANVNELQILTFEKQLDL